MSTGDLSLGSRHYHESQQIHISFPLNHCLQIWIIYFGESFQKWKIIILHGFYGIYGKEVIIKYLAIWIWIQEIFSNWQKHNRYFGQKHKTLLYRESIKLNYQYHRQYRLYQVDGALRMNLGKSEYIFRARMIQYSGRF